MGTYVYHEELKFRFSHVPGRKVSREPNCASLDEALVKFPLCVRPVRQGERFIPFGMTGSRLVSDFLTDKKRSPYEKRCQLVLACTQGEESSVIWLVNERTDGRFAVTDRTKHVLVIKKLE
jgi:tRNA(Ile)-lysidine synthase